MPFTYILYSDSAQKFYTGCCHDLHKRLQRHNNAVNPATKFGVPWKLIWSQNLSSLSEARRLETKIKKRGAKRFLSDINHSFSD